MKSIKRFLRVLAIIAMGCVCLIVALAIFLWVAPSGARDFLLLAGRLITGFWFFFRENLPAISWDVGTWGPGLGAFLLALAFAHHFFKSLAARMNCYWSFASSFCLVLSIPVLFVIAFLVPGILLQWEILRQVPWIEVR